MNLFKYKLIYNSLERQWFPIILKRYKSKKSLKFGKEIGPHIKALNHFDDFYKAVFGEKWPSVRLGLLSKQKYIAVINNFGEVEKTEKLLESLGSFNLRSFFEVQKNCVNDLTPKESLVNKNNPELDEILLDKLKEEEDKESHLRHPEGVEFSTKVHDFSKTNEENENNYESIYKVQEGLSSLASDMKKAELDEERIIMPESATDLEILSNFIPATKLRGVDHFIPESEYYKYYKVKSDSSILLEEELELDFPENLNVYSFDRGEILDFPDPTRCINNVYNYMKVDGADLLASLALGVEPSDTVLDMCSTSNISFCLFQTLRPKLLICTNDIENNISDLFSDYLFEGSAHWKEMLLVTSSTLDENKNGSMFDKVLVDVPSTFDRTSLFEREDNPFHVTKLKCRLQLPEYQKLLLVKGLRFVRPGGVVLYTTSTLSPIQNDGVVYEALKTAWNDHKIECTVKNLTPALRHTSLLFNYGDYLNLKFGTLVVPFVPSNFGPRYICKIIRNEKKEAEKSSDEVKPEEFL